MKWNLMKYFEKLAGMLAASAFAELGEHETAREMVSGYLPHRKLAGEREKDQTAVVFAESREFDSARDRLKEHGEVPERPADCQYEDNDFCCSQA